jgi:hypothetical protein
LTTFLAGVNAPVQYGSGAKAFATLLNQQYLLPFAKVSDLFDTLFGQPFNVSSLESSNERVYDALQTTETVPHGQTQSQNFGRFPHREWHTGIRQN